MDGASNSLGSGTRVIMTNPDKTMEIQCVLRFKFEATNNEADYKVAIIALELIYNLELEHVKLFSDSQLMVR